MVWEIWKDRGYCALGDTISAYVDFTPTPCGAIRCIGPFSVEGPSQDRMQHAMRSLTTTLESSFLPSNQFVAWGAYSDFTQYREHEVTILGTVCGYIPAPWLRTQLLGYDSSSLSREWQVTPDKIVHRSGLQFPELEFSEPDPCLFHPSNSHESIAKLLDHSKIIGLSNQVNSRKINLTPPVLRWSPSAENGHRYASGNTQ